MALTYNGVFHPKTGVIIIPILHMRKQKQGRIQQFLKGLNC